MATEDELRKIIRQLQEKVASLATENELLKRKLDRYEATPHFAGRLK